MSAQARAAVHNVVGPRPPLGVGKLAREKMLELVDRHAGPSQHACALHMGGALSTIVTSTRRSAPVSNSSGISSTASSAPFFSCFDQEIDLGLHHHGMHDCSRAVLRRSGVPAIFAASSVAVDFALPRVTPGNAASIAGLPRPHRGGARRHRRRTRGCRARAKCSAAADLPMPIPPVSPMTSIMRSERCRDMRPAAQASPRGARRTSARSPAPPGAAACRDRPRPAVPRARAAASRAVSSGL